jgi:uncharacterized LabA/DUF88 family protein
MSRIVVLIDGFNLYHALEYNPVSSRPSVDPRRYNKYKWLNLHKLAECFVLDKKDTLVDVFYFTTLALWDPGKVARHKEYIRALELQGIKVIYGEFKRKQKHCNLCKKNFWTFEEKQTDVNIALKLLTLAVIDAFDKAIIISGDTDLLPAVKAVQATFPHKQVGVVIPIGKASENFKNNADFHYKMKEKHLQVSLLADPVILPDGSRIICPTSWK